MSPNPPTQEQALELMREVFAECLPEHPVPDDEVALFGPDAQLTSMELVSLVADVEELINDRWDTQIILADERALSRSKSPFRNLAALAAYVTERLTHG